MNDLDPLSPSTLSSNQHQRYPYPSSLLLRPLDYKSPAMTSSLTYPPSPTTITMVKPDVSLRDDDDDDDQTITETDFDDTDSSSATVSPSCSTRTTTTTPNNLNQRRLAVVPIIHNTTTKALALAPFGRPAPSGTQTSITPTIKFTLDVFKQDSTTTTPTTTCTNTKRYRMQGLDTDSINQNLRSPTSTAFPSPRNQQQSGMPRQTLPPPSSYHSLSSDAGPSFVPPSNMNRYGKGRRTSRFDPMGPPIIQGEDGDEGMMMMMEDDVYGDLGGKHPLRRVKEEMESVDTKDEGGRLPGIKALFGVADHPPTPASSNGLYHPPSLPSLASPTSSPSTIRSRTSRYSSMGSSISAISESSHLGWWAPDFDSNYRSSSTSTPTSISTSGSNSANYRAFPQPFHDAYLSDQHEAKRRRSDQPFSLSTDPEESARLKWQAQSRNASLPTSTGNGFVKGSISGTSGGLRGLLHPHHSHPGSAGMNRGSISVGGSGSPGLPSSPLTAPPENYDLPSGGESTRRSLVVPRSASLVGGQLVKSFADLSAVDRGSPLLHQHHHHHHHPGESIVMAPPMSTSSSTSSNHNHNHNHHHHHLPPIAPPNLDKSPLPSALRESFSLSPNTSRGNSSTPSSGIGGNKSPYPGSGSGPGPGKHKSLTRPPSPEPHGHAHGPGKRSASASASASNDGGPRRSSLTEMIMAKSGDDVALATGKYSYGKEPRPSPLYSTVFTPSTSTGAGPSSIGLDKPSLSEPTPTSTHLWSRRAETLETADVSSTKSHPPRITTFEDQQPSSHGNSKRGLDIDIDMDMDIDDHEDGVMTGMDVLAGVAEEERRHIPPAVTIPDQQALGQPNPNVDQNGVGPKYICAYCQKTFSRPSSLRIHTYSHTGERPYICKEPSCRRRFSVQSNLKRHAKVHQMSGGGAGGSAGTGSSSGGNSTPNQSTPTSGPFSHNSTRTSVLGHGSYGQSTPGRHSMHPPPAGGLNHYSHSQSPGAPPGRYYHPYQGGGNHAHGMNYHPHQQYGGGLPPGEYTPGSSRRGSREEEWTEEDEDELEDEELEEDER